MYLIADRLGKIIENKKAEESLKVSESKYRSLFEFTHEGIVFSDSEGKISSVNSAFSAMLGYDGPEELAGIPAVELYVDPKARKSLFKELKKNGYVKDYELDFRKKDGSIVNITCNTQIRRDENGNIIQTESIIRDITERKKAEADLRLLATIVADSNDAVTVVDLKRNIVDCNKGAEDMYGYSKEEALGMDILKTVPEDKKSEILDLIEKIKINKIVGSFETKRLAKDGHVLDVGVTATKLVDNESNVVAIAITERDITGKKLMEERLHLSERFNLLGKLASSVAHELRNPLGVINNAIYFLSNRLKEVTDPKVVKHLKIMENNINSANQIISDLLDLSRDKICDLQLVDLNLLLENVFNSISVPENIKLITKFDKIPKIMLDPGAIKRVFLNLIYNAFAAMPQGGKLVIATSISGDILEISFKDSGVGISEENMKKLFTPLFTTKAKGLGLGLTLSNQIIEKHKGNITVKSKVGEGALFIVRLPNISKKQVINDGLLQNEVLIR
jgi:PAS domain S-box-containing protein